MIEVRDYQKEDYELLKDWWVAAHGYAMPEHWLPGIGYIAFEGDVNICAAFMYHDPSAKFAWVAWHTFNQEIRGVKRSDAFKVLISRFDDKAKEMGIGEMFTAVNNPSLLGRLLVNNYTATDVDCVHLIRKV